VCIGVLAKSAQTTHSHKQANTSKGEEKQGLFEWNVSSDC
jgi:hypothetical protein